MPSGPLLITPNPPSLLHPPPVPNPPKVMEFVRLHGDHYSLFVEDDEGFDEYLERCVCVCTVCAWVCCGVSTCARACLQCALCVF